MSVYILVEQIIAVRWTLIASIQRVPIDVNVNLDIAMIMILTASVSRSPSSWTNIIGCVIKRIVWYWHKQLLNRYKHVLGELVLTPLSVNFSGIDKQIRKKYTHSKTLDLCPDFMTMVVREASSLFLIIQICISFSSCGCIQFVFHTSCVLEVDMK